MNVLLIEDDEDIAAFMGRALASIRGILVDYSLSRNDGLGQV